MRRSPPARVLAAIALLLEASLPVRANGNGNGWTGGPTLLGPGGGLRVEGATVLPAGGLDLGLWGGGSQRGNVWRGTSTPLTLETGLGGGIEAGGAIRSPFGTRGESDGADAESHLRWSILPPDGPTPRPVLKVLGERLASGQTRGGAGIVVESALPTWRFRAAGEIHAPAWGRLETGSRRLGLGASYVSPAHWELFVEGRTQTDVGGEGSVGLKWKTGDQGTATLALTTIPSERRVEAWLALSMRSGAVVPPYLRPPEPIPAALPAPATAPAGAIETGPRPLPSFRLKMRMND